MGIDLGSGVLVVLLLLLLLLLLQYLVLGIPAVVSVADFGSGTSRGCERDGRWA